MIVDTLVQYITIPSQIAKFMGSTWGPPASCRPQIGPMLAPWISATALTMQDKRVIVLYNKWFQLHGPWFNIKMPSYQYRKSHCGDKTVVRLSHLHNGISYTGHVYIESRPWVISVLETIENGTRNYFNCLRQFDIENMQYVNIFWFKYRCRFLN